MAIQDKGGTSFKGYLTDAPWNRGGTDGKRPARNSRRLGFRFRAKQETYLPFPFIMKYSLIAVFFAAAFLSAGSLRLSVPENGGVVSPLTPMQHLVTLVSMEQQESLWKDHLFLQSLSQEAGSALPRGIQLGWKYLGEEKSPLFRVQVGPEGTPESDWDAYEFRGISGHTQRAWLQNLLPGVTYAWRVSVLSDAREVLLTSETRTFSTEDRTPRVLHRAGWNNLRDLGGKPGAGGARTRFDRIYRAAAYNASTAVPANYKEWPVLEQAPFFRTELDLRWGSENPAPAPDTDPEKTQFLNIPTKLYTGLLNDSGMTNYRQLMTVFANPENYPILFHCHAGADRTGTLAAMLQALLGCSRDDIRRDFVFTSFSGPMPFTALDIFLDRLDEFTQHKGRTLQEQAEQYLLRCGVPYAEILSFQRIMLGNDYQPSETLREARRLEEFMGTFSKTPSLQFLPPAADHAKMLQAGRFVEFKAGTTPAFAGENPQGELLFLFRNNGAKPRIGAFLGESLATPAYHLLKLSTHEAILSPTGNPAWTPAELHTAPLTLPAASETLFLLTPAASGQAPLPQDCTATPYTPPAEEQGDFLVASSKAPVPVIDGSLQDEAWAAAATYTLTSPTGVTHPNQVIDNHNAQKDDTHRVTVKLATDPEHNTLFLAVELQDNTPSAQTRPHDGAVWEDDEVEVFLAAANSPTYYQFIVNRKGSTMDGKGWDPTWNLQDFQAATQENNTSWTAEIALPLAQFNLDAPLELNVCTSDFPAKLRKNLGDTYEAFHCREALLPVLLE